MLVRSSIKLLGVGCLMVVLTGCAGGYSDSYVTSDTYTYDTGPSSWREWRWHDSERHHHRHHEHHHSGSPHYGPPHHHSDGPHYGPPGCAHNDSETDARH